MKHQNQKKRNFNACPSYSSLRSIDFVAFVHTNRRHPRAKNPFIRSQPTPTNTPIITTTNSNTDTAPATTTSSGVVE